jgi:hypothetical protein
VTSETGARCQDKNVSSREGTPLLSRWTTQKTRRFEDNTSPALVGFGADQIWFVILLWSPSTSCSGGFLTTAHCIIIIMYRQLAVLYNIGKWPEEEEEEDQTPIASDVVNISRFSSRGNEKETRLKILPGLTREHYTSLLHWVYGSNHLVLVVATTSCCNDD